MMLRNTARLPRAVKERKTRFYQALVAAGVSMSAWARAENVTPGHVSQVLNGKRPGFGLDEKIEAFIAKHTARVA